ncbi:MAG TPA: glycoside hydrolase family 20 zincin-like fold domain-containing protein, partial [Pirellulales bacterium]
MTRANGFRSSIVTLGLLVLLATSSVAAGERTREDLGVIPTPQQVTWDDGTLRVDDSTTILLPDGAPEGAKFAATNLQERLAQQTGLKLQISRDPATTKAANSIAIGNPKTDSRVAEAMKAYGLELSDEMKAEGYVLAIGKHGIVIGAESDRGLLYGTATLRQMLL